MILALKTYVEIKDEGYTPDEIRFIAEGLEEELQLEFTRAIAHYMKISLNRDGNSTKVKGTILSRAQARNKILVATFDRKQQTQNPKGVLSEFDEDDV